MATQLCSMVLLLGYMRTEKGRSTKVTAAEFVPKDGHDYNGEDCRQCGYRQQSWQTRLLFASGTQDAVPARTAAPTGWTKDTSRNDKASFVLLAALSALAAL